MCVSDWKSRIPVKGNILNSTYDSGTRRETMASKRVVLHLRAPAHSLLVNLLIRTVICNYPHNRGLVNTLLPHCTNTLGLPSNTSVPLFFQISPACPTSPEGFIMPENLWHNGVSREGRDCSSGLSDNKTEARDPPFTLVLAGNKSYECPRSYFFRHESWQSKSSPSRLKIDLSFRPWKIDQIVFKNWASSSGKKPSVQAFPSSHFENKGQIKNSVCHVHVHTFRETGAAKSLFSVVVTEWRAQQHITSWCILMLV